MGTAAVMRMTIITGRRGFTLIELMITVAVVGILAAIAYPSYQNSVTKSRRAEGKSLVLDAAAREERFFAQYNSYTGTVVGASGCTGSACGLNYSSTNSANGYYVLTVPANSATTYTLTATAAGTQLANDKNCKTFSIDNLGVKTSTNNADAATTDCW